MKRIILYILNLNGELLRLVQFSLFCAITLFAINLIWIAHHDVRFEVPLERLGQRPLVSM